MDDTAEQLVAKFIARIDRLEIRYKRDQFATSYLVPADELKAVRTFVKQRIAVRERLKAEQKT